LTPGPAGTPQGIVTTSLVQPLPLTRGAKPAGQTQFAACAGVPHHPMKIAAPAKMPSASQILRHRPGTSMADPLVAMPNL